MEATNRRLFNKPAEVMNDDSSNTEQQQTTPYDREVPLMATVVPIQALRPNPQHPESFGPTPDFESIPTELRTGKWCVWRAKRKAHNKIDKIPTNGQHGISTAKPEQWLTYEQAKRIYERHPTRFNGIGRLVDKQFIIADLDGTTSIPPTWPATYTELSPSGNGLRLVWQADVALPCDLTKPIEIYSGHQPRYVTFTGYPVGPEGAFRPITNAGPTLLSWVEGHRGSTSTQIGEDEPSPKLLDPEDLPDAGDLGLPRWAQALLFEGQVEPSSPGSDLSRSGVLMSAVVWLYTNTQLSDAEILTLLQDSPGALAIALDHRHQAQDKALDYLWDTCLRARPRRGPPVEEDFIPLDDWEGEAQPTPTPTEKEKKRGLQLTFARELLKKPAPLRWLIKGWALPESQILLFGDPVTGKSLLSIDWACSVALGRDWLGRSTDQGPVIYIAGEGHHGISRRLKAWAITHDCEAELREAPIVFSRVGTALIDPASRVEALREIDQVVAQTGKPKLIVIDTVSRNLGGDENSSQDISAYFAVADRLRDRYSAAVLHVHHSGHGDKTRSRGNSGFRGNTDTELMMVSEGAIKTLSCPVKMKDSPLPAPLSFTVQQVLLDDGVDPWLEEDGEIETSAVLVPVAPGEGGGTSGGGGRDRGSKPAPSWAKYGLETLAAAMLRAGRASPEGEEWPFPEGEGALVVHLEDWRKDFYARHTGTSTGAKRAAFARAVKDLVGAKAVGVWEDLYWPSIGIDCPWHGLDQIGETAPGEDDPW